MNPEATFPGNKCRKHGTTERYLDTRRCVECQGAPTLRKPEALPATLPKPGRKPKIIRTVEEIRAYERKKRGLPLPTRPEPETCENCGRKPKGTMHLDHCYETGEFRGWLCQQCNTGLGLIGDTLEAVDRIANYLTGRKNVNELMLLVSSKSSQSAIFDRDSLAISEAYSGFFKVPPPCQGGVLPLN